MAGALAVVAVAAYATLSALRDGGSPSGVMALDPADPAFAELAGLLDQEGVLDSDRDGLPDAVETLVFGSDPARWNSSGTPVPDGWLARHGHDPNDPQAALRPAAVPPASALPKAYGNRWPDRFTLTLGQAYAHGRPANWTEATQGAFDSGIDPREWDQDGDGIPDGWAVAHGLDPRAGDLAGQRLAGPEGLTVLEAFRHGTSPRSLDSDDDGLPDREELAGAANPRPTGPARFPPSDPARPDTAGAGVCDGYLARHGLDPTDPAASLGDPDRDGATTRQEYQWSANRTTDAQACRAGGLDPTRQETADAGIPDGWLIAHGLDPLQAGVATRVTQTAAKDGRPAGVPAPEGDRALTVRDEYAHGRPPSWSEPRDGPWLGGTDPASNDTDRDGLGDAYEAAGFRLVVAADPAQPAGVPTVAASDPRQGDGDGDGLLDAQEAQAGTHPLRPDTDFDGIADGEERRLDLGLDPARADSTGDATRAGDLMRDGDRLALLRQRSQDLLAGTPYPYPGPPGAVRPPAAWAAPLPGAAKLGNTPSASQLAALLGPSGDADDDQVPNILDPDIDGDGVVNGPEVDPRDYVATRFGLGPLGGRSATDPLSPDTDGDLLRDAWEVENGVLRAGALTLDPAAWDTDGDCTPAGPDCRNDGAEDPDQDGTVWPRFTAVGGVPTLQNQSAPFTNVREQAAGTDPNDPQGDGDGLLDGWKAFWGIDYPLLPRTVPSLGLYFPASVPDAPRPVPGTAQPAGTPSSTVAEARYWRSVPMGATLAAQFGETPTGQTTQVQRAEGPLVVANVTGVVRLDYQEVQRLGTNPYLADTDGDGLPDWWERLHAQPLPGMPAAAGCVQAGLDPLRHEPDGDPDGDRLRNADEYAAGSDPLCRDSDLGGVPDGEEWLRAGGGRLLPTRPADDISLLDDDIDQDADGAPDFDEITRLLTRYDHPDTDGDGLLDGPSLPESGCWTPLSGPDGPDDARARRLLDLGMAYEVRGGCHVFLGEGDPQVSLDPRQGDDYGVGVPAGWILVKMPSFDPASAAQADRARDHYRLGRPLWWDEPVHGPWWGGADPQAGLRGDIPNQPLSDIRNSPDLDGDGLRDVDATGLPSEDPYPAGNAANTPRDVPGLAAGTDPRDGLAPDIERRVAGQAMLSPAPYTLNARNAIPHPSPGADDRSLPCLVVQSAPDELRKGREASVAGRLTRRGADGACTGEPLPGIAVEALAAGRPFGAAFTGPDGTFTLPVNVSSAPRELALPPAPASAFQGRLAGVARWTPDAVAATVGPQELLVRSSATAALRAATQARPIDLVAGAVLEVEAPEQTRTDRQVPVRMVLRDTAGSPLRDPVRVWWLGRWLEDLVLPGTDGSADLVLPGVPASSAGNVTLRLESQPENAYTDAATAVTAVSARRPGVLQLQDPARADGGTVVRLKGQYRDLGADRAEKGVPDARVDVALVLPGGPLSATARTAADGRFQVDFALPSNAPAGAHEVRAVAPGTAASSPASDETVLHLRGLPRFDQVLAAPLLANETQQVAARLVAADGVPVAGVPVEVRLGAARRVATTDADGRLAATLDAQLAPGQAKQALAFAGDERYAPASHVLQRTVASRTHLTLPAGTLARGADALLNVTLTDAAGDPVAGAAVAVAWGDEAPRTVLTDASGRGRFHRPAADPERLGTILVRATYAGSASAALAPSNASQAWTVQAQARIELPQAPVLAGGPPPTGRLVDAGTGVPLAQRTILRGADQVPVVTDAQGRFGLGVAPPADATPAVLRVPVRFPGDGGYPATQATAELRILSPATLEPQVPAQVTTGRPTLVHAHLRDGRGLAPTGGALQVLWQGQAVGEATVAGSPAPVTITLPAQTPAGPLGLDFRYLGSSTHAAAQAQATAQAVQGATLVADAKAARPGDTAIVRVSLAVGERPLADRTVVLVLEGAPNGIEAVTGADGVATFAVHQAGEQLAFVVRSAGDAEVAPASAAGALLALQPPDPVDRGLQWAWPAAGAAALAALLLLALVLRGRDPLDAALHQARRALQARDADERRVLLAYRALEDAAIAMELLAGPATTPRALQQVLAPRLASQAHPALDRLMGVFEAARYGAAPVGRTHCDAAVGCLQEIQAAWQAGGA